MGRDAELQQIAERILEDESLRRGLTDDAFQPLLDWAIRQLKRGGRVKSDPGAVGVQIRTILQAASSAASDRDLRPLRSLVTAPVFSRRESTRIATALSHLQLTVDPDANAIQIAKILAVKR